MFTPSPARTALLRLFLALFLVCAAGCATTVTTQVTSFHQLPDGLQGQRFVIVPTSEQQSSLEFGTYADLVRQSLVEKGLVDGGEDRARADLGVSMAYEVVGRGAGLRSGNTGYAGFGAGSGGFSVGGIGIGIGFPIGGGPSGETNYQRSLQIRIDRLAAGASTAPAGGQASPARVFEARAICEGPSASIAPVMRAMVQAIFEDFPGESGKTRVVSTELDEAR